jgi:hypothetical protein
METTLKLSNALQFAEAWGKAHAAGMQAASTHRPTPMVVGTPLSPFGGGIDYSRETYIVSQGVCGFAWVVIRPANSAFARWAKKTHGLRSGYGGGLHYWIGDFGQAYELKLAYARAFADTLREFGIRAFADSRLD